MGKSKFQVDRLQQNLILNFSDITDFCLRIRYNSIRNFLAHTLIRISTTAAQEILHGQRSQRAKDCRSQQVCRQSRGASREKRPTTERSQTQRGSSGKQNK